MFNKKGFYKVLSSVSVAALLATAAPAGASVVGAESSASTVQTQLAKASLVDGEYTINFFAHKELDSTEDYTAISSHFDKTAKLKIENGKKEIYLSILAKSASMIPYVEIEENGVKVQSEDVGIDEATGNKIVKLAVEDLSAVHKAAVRVVVPAANMDKEYPFYLGFDTNSITPADNVVTEETADFDVNFAAMPNMNDYFKANFFETPAVLKTENGKKFVYLKFVKHALVATGYQVKQGEEYKDLEVIDSTDTYKQVKFEVADFAEPAIIVIKSADRGNSELQLTFKTGQTPGEVDTTPPSFVNINSVSDKSTSITGTTEAKAKVELFINGTYAKATTADAKGKFTFSMKKKKAGVKVTVVASDAAGNKTEKTVTVIDKTPPSLTVKAVNSKSTKVTGKTEAKAIVQLYVNGKYAKKVKADAKGAYSVSMAKKKAGVKLKVVASDNAGNKTQKTITVKK